MSRISKLSIIIVRVAVGWFFLYQGVVAILNSNWSIGPYIKGSVMFPQFYATLLEPQMLSYMSFLTKGIFVLIGALLIAGIFVRISSVIGILLTLFIFYFPALRFPYINGLYIVDEHLILALTLFFLYAVRAGEYFGLGSMFKFSRY